MVTINLLPWRAIAYTENIKKRKICLVFFAVLFVLWIICHVGLNLVEQSYDTSIENLQAQLTELADQKQQVHINPAASITEQIHANQFDLIDLFKNMEQKTLFWSGMVTNKNNHIVITGDADSYSMLSQFVNTYNAQNKNLPMLIQSVKKSDEVSAIQFRLQLLHAILPILSQIKNDNDV